MAAPATYDELRASLAEWLTRDDLDTRIPEFISLAEKRLAAKVYSPERFGSTTLSLSTGTVALPADYDGARVIWIDGNPRTVLSPLEYGQLLETYPISGVPEKYAVIGANLAVGPAPLATTTLNLTYWKKLVGLGPSQASNWLLAIRPDLYLAACLVEGYLFLKDEGRARDWDAITERRISDANDEATKRWYSSAPLVPQASVVV